MSSEKIEFLTFNGKHFAELSALEDKRSPENVHGFFKREPNGVSLYKLNGELDAFIVDRPRQSRGVVSAGVRNGAPFYMQSTTSLTETWLGLEPGLDSSQFGRLMDVAKTIEQMSFSFATDAMELGLFNYLAREAESLSIPKPLSEAAKFQAPSASFVPLDFEGRCTPARLTFARHTQCAYVEVTRHQFLGGIGDLDMASSAHSKTVDQEPHTRYVTRRNEEVGRVYSDSRWIEPPRYFLTRQFAEATSDAIFAVSPETLRYAASTALLPSNPGADATVSSEYAFDLKLTCSIRVHATSEASARELVLSALNAAQLTAGEWPSGSPIVFEGTADAESISRFEPDGDVAVSVPRQHF